MHGTQNILEKHITEICSECCCLGSTASNDGLWNREIGKQIKKNGMTFGRLKSKMRTELHLVHNKPTLYRPGVPYFLFSFTTCLFNFFFLLLCQQHVKTKIILKYSNLEANQSATQPHGAETVWRTDIIIAM
jgi:hypothetical protein